MPVGRSWRPSKLRPKYKPAEAIFQMASFIHIADEKKRRLIEKNGIKAGKQGVFCCPVTKNFPVTHQWSRELKRTGVKSLVCVQFRIPDNEMVSVGAYNSKKIAMSASEAVATVMEHDSPMGLEVLIPRKVLAKEISKIYPTPKLIGWRYYPEAKGKKPFCHCRFCNRGEIRAQRLIREDD
jgi:hypothetical protein